jgi:hypothetical protein
MRSNLRRTLNGMVDDALLHENDAGTFLLTKLGRQEVETRNLHRRSSNALSGGYSGGKTLWLGKRKIRAIRRERAAAFCGHRRCVRRFLFRHDFS